ncbi:MAG TPA: nuclear transport factor 2 family protein [Candidatus Binatia bacterium]|nr:nuclear transport factor 2 family protein [Candidatus Binatia bacterium]
MRTAAEFVDGFARFWSAPGLDGFATLLAPDVRLVQPLAPTMHGLAEVRDGFAKIFAWLPDIRGEVDRWSARDDVVFIEFRLRATLGGRPFEWPLVDRFVLGADGLAIERVTYFDALPVLAAAITRPAGWRQLWRSGAATALLRRAPVRAGSAPLAPG